MPLLKNKANDPVTLNTLWWEIQSLKELLEARIQGVEKGIEVAHEDLIRFPTEVEKSVAGLQKLMDTKIAYENKLSELQFKQIENQFTWMNSTMNKSETSTTKQIDQLGSLLNTISNNLNDKIADLKDTVNNREGRKEGVKDFRDWVPWIIAIATFLLYLYNKGK